MREGVVAGGVGLVGGGGEEYVRECTSNNSGPYLRRVGMRNVNLRTERNPTCVLSTCAFVRFR